MKTQAIIFTSILFVISAFRGFSQDVGAKTLISQSRTTTANIGNCNITIKYHSPTVNGRKIFGGIVPYNFEFEGKEYPWRAGSNQRTTIEFSHDVKIEGQSLTAGSYGFLVLVDEDEWTLIFSSGKSWGAFNYDKSNDVLRVPVKPQKVPFQEWLSYDFLNPNSESVDIQLLWEETAVEFAVTTNALENLLTDLNKKEEKDANDYQELAALTLEQDPSKKDEALAFLEQSAEQLPNIEKDYYRKAYDFNYKIRKAELLISKGEKKDGNRLWKETLGQATAFDIYYLALRKYTVDGQKTEAFRILSDATKRYPDNFQNHFAFGEYYLKEGNQEKATEHFKKAYDMTVAQDDGWLNYARYLYLQNKLALEANQEQ